MGEVTPVGICYQVVPGETRGDDKCYSECGTFKIVLMESDSCSDGG